MAGASNPANTVTPAAGNNVYSQAAQLFQQAAKPNIGAFQNPYTQQVINRSQADLGRQQAQTLNTLGASATAAGAFGGSRHGIAEAEVMKGYAQIGADMAANLRHQGFNTALGAAQNQQQMQSQLAGQGFGFGQQIGQQQATQGAQQQALMQSLINAAKGQYAGYTGAPQQALQLPLAALGAIPMGGGQTTTQSQTPGLFNLLALGLGGF